MGMSSIEFQQKDIDIKFIRDVFRENLVEEVNNICSLSKQFNVVSFDTEFPGVVYFPENTDQNLINPKLQ